MEFRVAFCNCQTVRQPPEKEGAKKSRRAVKKARASGCSQEPSNLPFRSPRFVLACISPDFSGFLDRSEKRSEAAGAPCAFTALYFTPRITAPIARRGR